MKFIVDAQLPYVLNEFLKESGVDSIHTDNLTNKERTTDTEIRKIAHEQNRIVISKDGDFVSSHLLQKSPEKLLWITTVNIRNKELLDLFRKNINTVIKLFDTYDLIEMNNTEIKGHE